MAAANSLMGGTTPAGPANDPFAGGPKMSTPTG